MSISTFTITIISENYYYFFSCLSATIIIINISIITINIITIIDTIIITV